MEQQQLGRPPYEVLVAQCRASSRGWSVVITHRAAGASDWQKDRYEALTEGELAQVLEEARAWFR
jgi:hypothetical protein